MVSVSTMSHKQIALLVWSIIVTTISVLALIIGLVHKKNADPTMLSNGLDVISTGSWILFAISRLHAHVDTAEKEIRTDVIYSARGRLHKVD